jgi:hypothetical protein
MMRADGTSPCRIAYARDFAMCFHDRMAAMMLEFHGKPAFFSWKSGNA